MCKEVRQAIADAPAIQGAADKRQTALFASISGISDFASLGIICSARNYRFSPSVICTKKQRPVEKSVLDEIHEWQNEIRKSAEYKSVDNTVTDTSDDTNRALEASIEICNDNAGNNVLKPYEKKCIILRAPPVYNISE